MNKNQIREFVESHPELVTMKQQSNGLYVLKYKNKVFYKNLWTPELLECRGTVIDEDFNVVQRPFTKIYNLHENGARIPRDEIVIASRKVNGFMCAATIHNGEMLVSTTGSCDSDFVGYAKEMLSKTKVEEYLLSHTLIGGGYTSMFEIVHPEDPHIVKDEPGVYLLSIREKSWESNIDGQDEFTLDRIAHTMECYRPEWYRARFSDVQQWTKTCKHEGFVCYGKDTTLKMKSPYYLVTKFLARIRGEKLQTIIDTNPELLKERIDEEYYPLIDNIVSWKGMFSVLTEQERIKFIEQFFEGQLDK